MVKVSSRVAFGVQLEAHVNNVRLSHDGFSLILQLHLVYLIIGYPLDFFGLDGHAISAECVCVCVCVSVGVG